MPPEHPKEPQLEARFANGAFKPRVPASDTVMSSPGSTNWQSAHSVGVKRKAGNTTPSERSKVARNLLWNGFQEADIHELSTEDEADRERRRSNLIHKDRSVNGSKPTNFTPVSRSNLHHHSLMRGAKNPMDVPLPKKPVAGSTDKSQALSVSWEMQNQQHGVNNEVGSRHRVTISNGIWHDSSQKVQRAAGNAGPLDSSSKGFNKDELGALRRNGTKQSPILIDDKPVRSLQYPINTSKLAPRPTKSLTSKSAGNMNSHDRKQNNVSNSATPTKAINRQVSGSRSENLREKSPILPYIDKGDIAINCSSWSEVTQTLGLSHGAVANKDSESIPELHHRPKTSDTVATGSNHLTEEASDQEDDLQKALLEKSLVPDVELPRRFLPPLSLDPTRKIFSSYCEKQRQKYGIDSAEKNLSDTIPPRDPLNHAPQLSLELHQGVLDEDSLFIPNHNSSIRACDSDQERNLPQNTSQEVALDDAAAVGVAIPQTEHVEIPPLPDSKVTPNLTLMAASNKVPLETLVVSSRYRSPPKILNKGGSCEWTVQGHKLIAPAPSRLSIEKESMKTIAMPFETHMAKASNEHRLMDTQISNTEPLSSEIAAVGERDVKEGNLSRVMDDDSAEIYLQSCDHANTMPTSALTENTPHLGTSKTQVSEESCNPNVQKLIESQKSITSQRSAGGVHILGREEATVLLQQSRRGTKTMLDRGHLTSHQSNVSQVPSPHEDPKSTHSSFDDQVSGLTTHKSKKNSKNTPIDIEKVTDTDWLLVRMRGAGWNLPDICSQWEDLTGCKKSREYLRSRLVRLRLTFPDLLPNDKPVPGEARKRNLDILRQMRYESNETPLLSKGQNDMDKTQTGTTQESFAPLVRGSAVPFSYEKPCLVRPRSGGKKISEDLQRYILDSLDQNNDDGSESEYDEVETLRSVSPEADDDKVHFEYRVVRRTVPIGRSEDRCEWEVCSEDLTSITEANNAALEESKFKQEKPDIFPMTKWGSEIDEQTGLIEFWGSGPNGSIHIKTERILRTYDDGITPQSKLDWLKRRVYDIVEIRSTFQESVEWDEEITEEVVGHEDDLIGVQPLSTHVSEDDGEATSEPEARSTQHRTLNETSTHSEAPKCERESEGSDELDDLFEDPSQKNLEQLVAPKPKVIVRTITRTRTIKQTANVTERPMGAVHAVLDRANRIAGERFKELKLELNPDPDARRPKMDNYFARARENREMEKRLNRMELEGERFDDELQFPVLGDAGRSPEHESKTNSVQVKVIERTLENPRNF